MTSKKQMKSAARLYAVQALFQMEASDQTLDSVREQFVDHRFGAIMEGDTYAEGNVDLFDAISAECRQPTGQNRSNDRSRLGCQMAN